MVLGPNTLTTLVGVAGLAGVRVGPIPAGLNAPSGVAVLPDGRTVIASAQENCLLQLHK
jgi:glucose/arabinose dehydrogenase